MQLRFYGWLSRRLGAFGNTILRGVGSVFLKLQGRGIRQDRSVEQDLEELLVEPSEYHGARKVHSYIPGWGLITTEPEDEESKEKASG